MLVKRAGNGCSVTDRELSVGNAFYSMGVLVIDWGMK